MGLPLEQRRYTIAEYLELEEKSEVKNEFHDGEILAMAGGSYSQSRIIMNLGLAAGMRLKGSSCFMLESNMRVRVGKRLNYLYPDANIVCGKPEFDPDDIKQTTITNPRVIFEILSDSTERYDRGEKFSLYRDIDSMEDYVLVSQSTAMIETYSRQKDGAWRIAVYQGLAAVAKLPSVSIELPLAELYIGVDLVEK